MTPRYHNMFFIFPLASTELCVQSDRLNVDGMAAWAKERPWEMDQASRSVLGMFLTPVVVPVCVCVCVCVCVHAMPWLCLS